MDLRTTYLGLKLEHPLVASASPLTEKLDGFLRLEDGGAAAIVMHSLFEEQVLEEEAALDHYLHYGHESYAEALSYFPRAHEYRLTPERPSWSFPASAPTWPTRSWSSSPRAG